MVKRHLHISVDGRLSNLTDREILGDRRFTGCGRIGCWGAIPFPETVATDAILG
ncbi:MAG: hypothetical protein KME27_30805 [Lyngbya sp. HA4199-MV5]|nr:hypothetical protein [Lyngbya sp. HA4199-MV5]